MKKCLVFNKKDIFKIFHHANWPYKKENSEKMQIWKKNWLIQKIGPGKNSRFHPLCNAGGKVHFFMYSLTKVLWLDHISLYFRRSSLWSISWSVCINRSGSDCLIKSSLKGTRHLYWSRDFGLALSGWDAKMAHSFWWVLPFWHFSLQTGQWQWLQVYSWSTGNFLIHWRQTRFELILGPSTNAWSYKMSSAKK
jgi:hypothetical protein